jgi:POT family proton-dependent oligopeptide transporter
MTTGKPSSSTTKARMPAQIPYIIGNEACERFSFYGMRNILVEFLASSAILAAVAANDRQGAAKEVYHIFVMGVYFFPLLGGWLSDRFLGKYRTILWLSLVYAAGNACLAFFVDDKAGFYLGLFLISLGSGGIKPCVSAFMGEQFDQSNKDLAKVAFDAFYWIINFGSFFASWLIPIALSSWGPRWAFGIPGVLMFVATWIFWLGRGRYVVEPPRPGDPHSFARVVASAVRGGGAGLPLVVLASVVGVGFFVLAGVDLWRMVVLDVPAYLGVVQALCLGLVCFLALAGAGAWSSLPRARGAHPDDEVDGVRAVLRVLVLFVPVTAFWSLFDQKASTWVLQGSQMALPEFMQKASQMQSVNPLLVMMLIPLNNLVLYPALRRVGVEPTPVRKMTAGIVFAGIAWIVAGVLQLRIEALVAATGVCADLFPFTADVVDQCLASLPSLDLEQCVELPAGVGLVDSAAVERLSILWQLIPYALLTFGEVLVSATGLEFAYSQAPLKMKGVLMSFWSLSVTVGGLWVLLVNKTVNGEAAQAALKDADVGVAVFQMFFFAGFAFAAAAAFAMLGSRYRVVDRYRGGA